MSSSQNNYRPDIDGLRSLAVVPVLLFHAGFPLFQGGFVGVDIFFVISGFLITRLIVAQYAEERFSFLNFYERRIRRIFPALFAMLFCSWIAAMVLFLPVDFKEFSRTFLASVFSVSNILFFKESDYFDGPADLKPFLHTWSLGVEEQFYIFFPVLLCMSCWAAKKMRRRLLVPAILVSLLVLSMAACVVMTKWNQQAAFYLLPFRAWELLVGSVLALGIIPQVNFRVARNILAAGGLLIILAPVFLYQKGIAFPGTRALLPVAGTALLIYTGETGSAISRILCARGLVFTGLISYSLYIWHWPILAFARYYAPQEPSSMVKLCLILTSFLLAFFSWRWIERPARTMGIASSARPVFFLAATVISLAGLLATAGIVTHGFPGRLSAEALRYDAMLAKEQYFPMYDRGRCFLDYHQTAKDYDVMVCNDFERSDGLNILLFGDSFAAHLYPGMRKYAEVSQYTAASCRPIRTGDERCDGVYDDFFLRVLPQTNAQTIIVSSYWSPYIASLGDEEFSRRLGQTIQAIQAAGMNVLLIGQSPVYYKPVPRTLAIRGETSTADYRLPAKSAEHENAVLSLVAENNGVLFINPYELLCRSNDCLSAKDSEPFFWDSGHMTQNGSDYLAQLIFERMTR